MDNWKEWRGQCRLAGANSPAGAERRPSEQWQESAGGQLFCGNGQKLSWIIVYLPAKIMAKWRNVSAVPYHPIPPYPNMQSIGGATGNSERNGTGEKSQ